MHRNARRSIIGLATIAAGAALTGCTTSHQTALVDTGPFNAGMSSPGSFPQAPLVLGAGDTIGWSMYASAYADDPNGTFAGIPKVNLITANAPVDY